MNVKRGSVVCKSWYKKPSRWGQYLHSGILWRSKKSVKLVRINYRLFWYTIYEGHTISFQTFFLPDNGLAVRVFANRPGDLVSIPGRVIPKTQKMVLDASLLNTQHYKVRIKGKVEQSRKGVAPSPTPWCSKLSKREPSGHPRLWSPTLLTYCYTSYEMTD